MEIKEIKNKNVWEGFLLECEEKTFLDSWNWGEFQRLEGNKIWRLGVYDNNELVACALVIKIVAKRGTFLFLPHCPVGKSKTLGVLTNKLKEVAKKEKASFIRVAPIWEKNEENIKVFRDLGFRDAPIHMHPEVTWELDITSSEEELLMMMRKTTRYLIKQALKNSNIEIVKSQNIKDLEKFNEVYCATARRHKFVPFSPNYLKNQFLCFSPDNQILIFLGEYNGKIISSAIAVYWQGIGFYHHGASLSEYNKIPVSYLLQWEAIKEARRRSCKLYNFWGIVDQNLELRKHPWAGLTLFKMGFGGNKKEYVKTQDLVISPEYWLNFVFEKIRKIKRHL
ncbi:MAG: hypothetical protein COT32_02205 [Candidatus Nealsonbacteria bacterium CG08_land_8_20_14_0_20_36_22]|uniref:Methicillin resistance protein n=1 Tax=Candidatus Nealsonbacteria bacterium CG08_land_8_20_14_0_20_36_22 TaxID=1974704 RepID=A0A2H0YQE4_9BACT|nr:MAG: hypothetical protein COT32_02205 [Candidatus Nealsonbacteria bacterium CG08_land_8_20_14_0_20_36_22]